MVVCVSIMCAFELALCTLLCNDLVHFNFQQVASEDGLLRVV